MLLLLQFTAHLLVYTGYQQDLQEPVNAESNEQPPSGPIADEQFVLIDIPEGSSQSESSQGQLEKAPIAQAENGPNKRFGRSKSMQPRLQKKSQLEAVTDGDTEDSCISDNAAGGAKQTKDEYFGLNVPRTTKRS